MRTIYPKLMIVLIILIVAMVMNFKFDAASVTTPKPTIKVKKEVVIEKVYIKVPMPVDSIRSDSTIITLPKQPLVSPAPNWRKFRRSRNLHKNGYIS